MSGKHTQTTESEEKGKEEREREGWTVGGDGKRNGVSGKYERNDGRNEGKNMFFKFTSIY